MDDDRGIVGAAVATDPSAPNERRRFARLGEHVAVPTLVDQSVRSAELQLLDAREALKDARRRVVQLENAVQGWQLLRDEMMRADVTSDRAAS